MRMRTAFLWLMIGAFAAAAGLGIVGILFDDLGRMGERILVTSLLTGLYSLLCLACAIVMDRRQSVSAMWVGIGASVTALGLWMVLVWFDGMSPDDWIVRLGFTATVIAIAVPHHGLLRLLRLVAPWAEWVRRGTLAAAAALTLLVLPSIWFDWFEAEPIAKLGGVLAVLGSCGTVVTPVLSLIERIQGRHPAVDLPARIVIDLTCPRCRAAQQIETGAGACGSCGLKIRIEIEEPHCPCGYP
ncbi:MAG: hypothetical protein KDA25_06675, partial [Phycisphaerales bacterium]|nr:hypothetical protein [Phycisphaerales bacterium]